MGERPFKLWLYLLIVFGLSWPFQFISVLGPTTIAWAVIFNSLSMIMVGVGTFICGRYVFRDGFAGAGWRWGAGRYYAFALGFPALLWIVPALIDLSTGGLKLPRTITTTQIAWVLEMLFVVLIPAFGEEIGWRGYMLPRMGLGKSARRTVMLHGVIWYAWHLPIVARGAVAQIRGEIEGPGLILAVAAGLVLAMVPVVLDAAIFAWLWARSASIAVVTVFHAASDGFRDSLSITVGCGPVGDVASIGLTMLLGVLLLWKADWHGLLAHVSRPADSTDQNSAP